MEEKLNFRANRNSTKADNTKDPLKNSNLIDRNEDIITPENRKKRKSSPNEFINSQKKKPTITSNVRHTLQKVNQS